MKLQWILVALSLSSAIVVAQQVPPPVENEPHHRLLLQNESVLVIKVTLQPGESTLYHVHSFDRFAIYLSDTSVTWQEPGGAESAPEQHRPGDTSSREAKGPFTHRAHDVGKAPFEALDIELLHRPATSSSAASATVEAENSSGRAYKWTLARGDVTAMHTHQRPHLIVAATPLMLKMTSPDGQSSTHELKAGEFHWLDAKVSHTLANVGKEPGQIVEIELK